MVKRLRHRPFTAVTGVRIPYGSPNISYLICLVMIAEWIHAYPSRTRKLSTPAPMVLGPQGPGRVGRCQALYGGLAQLGEHLPYKQRVGGSIPSSSTINNAGWSSSVARRAHNPKVVGSNPAPATNNTVELWCRGLTCLPVPQEIAGSNPVSSAITSKKDEATG